MKKISAEEIFSEKELEQFIDLTGSESFQLLVKYLVARKMKYAENILNSPNMAPDMKQESLTFIQGRVAEINSIIGLSQREWVKPEKATNKK